MYAIFTCEQCFSEYNNESDFVICRGDACNEEVCKDCAKKCKNPECHSYVCDNCSNHSSSAKYCGEYCIQCAMWSTDPETADWVNFDFVAKGMTHTEGLAHLKSEHTEFINRQQIDEVIIEQFEEATCED